MDGPGEYQGIENEHGVIVAPERYGIRIGCPVCSRGYVFLTYELEGGLPVCIKCSEAYVIIGV